MPKSQATFQLATPTLATPATRATTRTGGQAEPTTKSSCSLAAVAARWLLLLAACHLKSVCNMLPARLPPPLVGLMRRCWFRGTKPTRSRHIATFLLGQTGQPNCPAAERECFQRAGAGFARAAAVPFARLVARIELATQPARLALAQLQQAVGSRLPRFMASKRLSNLILATRLTFSALASVARRLLKLAKWQDYD